MSLEAISKDELKIMLEVQSKSTEQLTIIASHLATIVDRENKIQERLYNGMAKEISTSLASTLKEVADNIIHNQTKIMENIIKVNENMTEKIETIPPTLSETLDKTKTAKIIRGVALLVGMVTIVVMISTVVLDVLQKKVSIGDGLHTIVTDRVR